MSCRDFVPGIQLLLAPALVAASVFPWKTTYEGATRDRVPGKLLRFHALCPEARQCEGRLIIDRREMAMWVFVPSDAAELMLDAVKTAARLLDEWEAAARTKN